MKNEDASHWKKLAAHTAVGAALGAGAAYLEHPKSKGKEKAKAALAGGLVGAADAGLHNYIDDHYESFERVAQTLSEDVPQPDRGEFQRVVEDKLKESIREAGDEYPRYTIHPSTYEGADRIIRSESIKGRLREDDPWPFPWSKPEDQLRPAAARRKVKKAAATEPAHPVRHVRISPEREKYLDALRTGK